MKISLLGIPAIKSGKHNLKDPRLDQADKLVEASKKAYAQVDVAGEEGALEADRYLLIGLDLGTAGYFVFRNR